MTRRRRLLAVLAAANVLNAVAIGVLLASGWLWPVAEAQEAVPHRGLEPALDGSDMTRLGAEQAKETYVALIEELTTRRASLDERAERLAERERQFVVFREELEAERERIEKVREEIAAERTALEEMRSPSFEQLLKAYGGMDAENAASALVELYDKDRMVVVDLLLGLKARQAGATLDALAATNPQVAADLSFEIWRRDPDRRRR